MAVVVSAEHVHLDEPKLVYNFTVKGPHTYFVLEVGVLVHNCNDGVEDQSLSLANERNQLSQRWEIAGYDPDSSKIKAFIEQGYAPEDMLVLYRGQGTIRRGSILSQAARAGGIEYSHEMFDGGLASWLKARDGRRFLSSHGIDYYELPDDDFLRILEVHRSLAYEDLGRSPFISTSKTLEVARFQFAQPGEHVIEILIPKNMVVDDLSNVRLGMPEGTAFDSVKLTGRNPHREDEFSMLHQIPNEYIIRYKKLGLFSWEDDPWQEYPH